jgi:hypothetical protein
MSSIFRQLPEICTPELSHKQRDTLLKEGKYILPGGDSDETVEYTIDTSENNDYLSYEYNFTTGQNGFIVFALRRFQKSDGESIVIFSRYGGMKRAFGQQDLKFFDIKEHSLSEINASQFLPDSISIEQFVKKQTPDSTKARIRNGCSSFYNLYTDKLNQIEFDIYPEYSLDEFEKWIISYTVTFTWTGNSFINQLKKE